MFGIDMESEDQVAAQSARLYRLFTLCPARVSLNGETVGIVFLG